MRVSFINMAAVVIVGISAAAQAQVAPANPAPCNLAHAPGVLEQQLMSGGLLRTYRLFVPAAYDGHTKIPLVLDLHPSGGTSAGQARTSGFEEVAAREVFAVVNPQAVSGTWNVPVQDNRPDDVKYVSDLIDQVASSLCIDSSRIYATGFSGGARMSSMLGCMLNTRIAAIAPVSGLRWPAPCGGRPIAVLTFHGLADPRNTYDGHADRGAEWVESVPDALAGWAEHNGCRRDVLFEDPDGPLSTMRYADCLNGAEVRMIRIDGLGHAWTRKEVDETVAIWQFFKGHRLPD